MDEMEDIPPDSIMYIATKDDPLENVTLLEANPLAEIISNHNEILVYRILSRLYDMPDRLSGCLSIDAEGNPTGVSPINWGFTLEVSEDFFAEIRTKYVRQVGFLCFWRKSVLSDSKLKKIKRDAKEFVRRLQGLIDQNLHLFSEDEILNQEPPATGMVNIFKDRYEAANRLLDVARQSDGPVKDWLERSISNKPIVSGAVYFSAAMMFFVALEAMVNLLYEKLLEDNFSHKIFNRHLEADLRIRICTMHLYCQGFDKPVLHAGDDLWNKYEELLKFRNHYIHGNISDEDKIYGAMEDGLIFYYQPRLQYRGKKKTSIFDNSFAFTDEEFVQDVKGVIDLTLDKVLEAMDKESRKLVESWINSSVIQSTTIQEA
jgi:hypothetical protein